MKRMFIKLKQNKKGFTLIELLVVIVLMGLLTGFLVPEMLSFNRRQILRSAVTEVVDEIRRTQSLATSGVQSEASFTAAYRFSFSQSVGDPANYYKGYRIVQIDESDTEVVPDLLSKQMACPVCIQSSAQNFNYSVPTGQVSGFSGSQHAALVCYPGQGHYTITIDQSGRVYTSDFAPSSCSCPVNSC